MYWFAAIGRNSGLDSAARRALRPSLAPDHLDNTQPVFRPSPPILVALGKHHGRTHLDAAGGRR
jgi:hypothetical protein